MRLLFFVCVTSVTLLFCSGCGLKDVVKKVRFKKSNIERMGWKAADYFDDPKIIAFCNAIEKGDIEAMDKLVDAGIDVNTKGKDDMSPVLWSFYAGDKVFEKVLAAGGDPNYVIGGDPNYTLEGDRDFKDKKKRDVMGIIRFGKKLYLFKGSSLLFLATHYNGIQGFERHVDILMKYGTNTEIGRKRAYATFFFLQPCLGDKLLEKSLDGFLQQSIDYGTDLNTNLQVIDERNDSYPNHNCEYYVTWAARNCRFNAAILLLESGAAYDTTTIPGGELQRILFGYKTTQFDSDDTEKDYQRLVKWLEDHGVSFDEPVPKEVSTKKPEPVRKKPKMVPNEE